MPPPPGKLAVLAVFVTAASLCADEPRSKHWAFQPLVRPSVPVIQGNQNSSPIDRFILTRLQPQGLNLSPEADRYALIRRLSFDLLGLPPTPAEIGAFISDAGPDAYEKLLDRLLASPHFGERWGRHWLDAAGYVDVMGTDNDAGILSVMDNRWRYRDYVVRAFNDDKPFDRFLLEQLAGDELVDWRQAEKFTPALEAMLVPTGFLRVAADDTDARELNTPDIRHGVLQRTIETVSSNLLALTLQCARCHDHKYEPISQRDYYRFQAFFQPAFNPDNWKSPKERQIAALGAAEKKQLEKHNADLDRRIEDAKKRQVELRRPYQEKLLEARLGQFADDKRKELADALRTQAQDRTESTKKLLSEEIRLLKLKAEELQAVLAPEDKKRLADLDRDMATAKAQRRSATYIQTAYDVGPPTPTYLLKRGNHLRPGAEVKPGLLSVLAPAANGKPLQRTPRGATSGRRLELAERLTEPGGAAAALVLRVRVNRIWQHLFGVGIVATSDNLGVAGSAPSHPELLDWLAARFAEDAQLLKPFLKRILLSATYRQTSKLVPHSQGSDPMAVDPDNRLLWKMRLRRLESESVRDSILAVSGTLDTRVGGAPVPVEAKPDGMIVIKAEAKPGSADAWRRSLYLLQRRNYHPTVLDVFDQPNLTTNCTARTPSAVVLQSLTMLNDGFILEQARFLSERVLRSARSPQRADRIDTAFRLVLGRPASEKEMKLAQELLERHESSVAITHLCHMLLNASEFLYIP